MGRLINRSVAVWDYFEELLDTFNISGDINGELVFALLDVAEDFYDNGKRDLTKKERMRIYIALVKARHDNANKLCECPDCFTGHK